MSWFGRSRARSLEELRDDPHFPMFAMRLAGAAEMAAVVLARKEDPDVQDMGRALGALASWFVAEEAAKGGWPEPATAVLPPVKEASAK